MNDWVQVVFDDTMEIHPQRVTLFVNEGAYKRIELLAENGSKVSIYPAGLTAHVEFYVNDVLNSTHTLLTEALCYAAINHLNTLLTTPASGN